jgi:hypothetical protein
LAPKGAGPEAATLVSRMQRLAQNSAWATRLRTPLVPLFGGRRASCFRVELAAHTQPPTRTAGSYHVWDKLYAARARRRREAGSKKGDHLIYGNQLRR